MKKLTNTNKFKVTNIINKLTFRNFCDVKAPNYKFTNSLEFERKYETFPIFRATDETGKVIDAKYDIFNKDTAVKILQNMVKINELDEQWNAAQRSGTISFYMTCKGEEAAVVSSCAAMEDHDSIYPQYREAAALLYRGATSKELANQLTGNHLDIGKGRQMPVHYGSKKYNYQTVSSPLATQIPQASGAGYLFRVNKQNRVCITYFGEGAASEGDFHAALNFAATLRSQTIFFCRNNKYAISTSFQDQYRGDGIASRGVGYGMKSIRIDGNDALGVYYAVKEARKYCVEKGEPVLIEAMSFRGGDHSTSDYSPNYRTPVVMKGFEDYLKKLGNAISRLENYCLNKKWIEQTTVVDWRKEFKIEARESLKWSNNQKKPSVDSMFEDTWDYIPDHLNEQKHELLDHLEKYGSHYSLHNYHKK